MYIWCLLIWVKVCSEMLCSDASVNFWTHPHTSSSLLRFSAINQYSPSTHLASAKWTYLSFCSSKPTSVVMADHRDVRLGSQFVHARGSSMDCWVRCIAVWKVWLCASWAKIWIWSGQLCRKYAFCSFCLIGEFICMNWNSSSSWNIIIIAELPLSL